MLRLFLSLLILVPMLPTKAAAVTPIPVECVVELTKNDTVIERHIGPCSYKKPLVVVPPKKMTFKTGTAPGSLPNAPQWITMDIAPGLNATLYVGHNVSIENPVVNLRIEFAIIELISVDRLPAFPEQEQPQVELPQIKKHSAAGSVFVRKGEIKVAHPWLDGEDRYELRVGLR